MSAPGPNQPLPVLVRLYRLALCLYPTAFRDEYAEEMQTIFCLRLEDAARSGKSATLGFACKEVVSLPAGAAAAHAQARKSLNILSFILERVTLLFERGLTMRIRHLFPKNAELTSWPIAILSLVPLLMVGPLIPLIGYHPWWNPDQLPLIEAVRLPISVSLLSLGFLVGILKQFPRWSYLYGVYMVVLLPLGIISLIDKFLIPVGYHFQGYVFLLLAVLVVVAAWRLPFLRPFFRNIRQDWTLLSYGLYAFTFFLLATNDRDESPVYSLQVQLPSLIAWLGALAYLRLADPVKKIGALLVAIFVGVLIWWWPIIDGMANWPGLLLVTGMLIFYWVGFGALVLTPIVMGIERSKKLVNE